MRKYIISFIIVIISIFLGNGLISMLKSFKKAKEPKTYRENVTMVEVDTLELKTNTPKVYTTGRIQSTKKSEVNSEVKGKIKYINPLLKKGQKVKKGRLLFSIDNTPAMQSFLASKNSYYNTIASILPDIKLDYKEDYKLWETYYKKIMNEKFPSQVPEIDNLSEKAFITNRGVFQSYYNLKSEHENLKKYDIYAPYNGTVDQTYLYEGSIVNPGVKLFSIIGSGDLEAEFAISTSDAKQIHTGSLVTIEHNNTVIKTKISRVGSYLDPTQQSIIVYAPVKNNNLRDGAYVEGILHGNPIKSSAVVPRISITDNKLLTISKDSTISLTPIELINATKDSVLIKGPKTGTVIITASPVKLKEGTKVKINE